MALNDNATLVIGTGHYFTAPVGTTLPADLTDVDPEEWENIGHTSLEDIFSQESEGGEATILGTLQNKALRTSRTPKNDKFNIVLQQFDTPALKLYHGSNAEELPDGSIGVPQNPVPTTAAFLAVFIDGEEAFAIHAPKSEILGTGSVDFSDTESLAGLPLAVQPLVHGSNKHAYSVTPIGDA